MSFLRNLLPWNRPQIKATQSETVALYLGGDGRMVPIKHNSGYISSSSAYRTNISHLLSHAEQYARAAIASVWAANSVNLRADTLARLDWFCRDKRTQERVERHPFEIALDQSRQNIIRRLEKTQLTYGETFIKPLANANGYNSGMWILNNLYVEVDTSMGYVGGFMYNPPGRSQTRYYQPGEIAYIYTENDFDDYRGLSKFEHILLEVGIDQNISRATASFYRNDARPGLLLLPEQDLSVPQAEEFITYWNAQFGGPGNKGRTALVPSVIKDVKEVQRAPGIDDVELRETTRREICAAFKVPLSMAGAWDDATYQSLPEQRKAFYEETIIPEAEIIARDLTRYVLPFFPDSEGVEVYFDAEAILALIENTVEKVDIAQRKLNSGAYTVNEFRQALGDEPIEGGDVYMLASGVTPVRELIEETPEPAPEQPQAPQLPAPEQEPEPEKSFWNQKFDRDTLYAVAELFARSDGIKGYNPDQPRDNSGRFGSGGGSGGGGGSSDGGGKKPKPSTEKPSWASGEKRNAGIQDGHLDLGHLDGNPVNASGEGFAKNLTSQHVGNLSADHREAAQVYAGESYKGINNGLRGKAELSADQKKTVDTLDKAVTQNTLDRDMVLYRGMKMNDDLRDQLAEGKTFTDSAYTSTSLDQSNPERFAGGDDGAVMRIKAPKGQNALAMSSLSEYPEEHEVLLPRNTQYKVTSVSVDPDTGKTYIDAEIVGG